MASAELTVAKAALSGALFRADPRSCSRDEIESMLALLSSAVNECSPPNVQKFKHWALSNLVPSSARVGPFCKYLVALVGSFEGDADSARGLPLLPQSKKSRVPSTKRRRLHVLYILNDILYHVKFRTRDKSFAEKLEPTLPPLVRSAASFSNSPKQIRKIQDLIALWEEQEYFPDSFVAKLRAAIDETPSPGNSAQNDPQAANIANSISKAAKAVPFVMPHTHGDLSTPWYDLPAGNWLPVLEPNSTRPINPAMIKPLVLSAGPADKTLVEAVKRLLVDVEKVFTKEASLDGPPSDIGQMGEFVEVNEIDGEVTGGDTYYGWSQAFCKKMRARKRGDNASDIGHVRGRRSARSQRSYSGSASRSRSPRRGRSDDPRSPARPAFKRTRRSDSPETRNRTRSRSRSWSRSRSSKPDESSSRRRNRSYQRSPSRSRSRSRSPSRARGFQPKSPSFGSRSSSRSPISPGRTPQHHTGLPPRPPNSAFMPPNSQPGNFHQPPHMSYPIPPPPIPPQGNFGHFPAPPPPPPMNYHGQWPPPPPMPMSEQPPQNFFPGGNMPPQFMGGWAAPPPPPPPQEQNMHHSGGRGGNGGCRGPSSGRGGGYGRGGGRW